MALLNFPSATLCKAAIIPWRDLGSGSGTSRTCAWDVWVFWVHDDATLFSDFALRVNLAFGRFESIGTLTGGNLVGHEDDAILLRLNGSSGSMQTAVIVAGSKVLQVQLDYLPRQSEEGWCSFQSSVTLLAVTVRSFGKLTWKFTGKAYSVIILAWGSKMRRNAQRMSGWVVRWAKWKSGG